MQADPHIHSKVADQVYKRLAVTEGRQPPGLVPVIFYREEILYLFQNIVNIIFMVEMCDIIRPGTQHCQKDHDVRFGANIAFLLPSALRQYGRSISISL